MSSSTKLSIHGDDIIDMLCSTHFHASISFSICETNNIKKIEPFMGQRICGEINKKIIKLHLGEDRG